MSFNEYVITEIGKMPQEWKYKKLGEHIEILTDYHANGSYKKLKENVELLDKPNYAIMIRTTNFEQNNFEDNLKYITEEAYNFLTKTKVFSDDILMNKIANPGSVYLMPKINKPVSLAMNLFLIRGTKDINQRYLYYFMKDKEKYIKLRATGTAAKTITKQAVREVPLFVPPLQEQKAIANILSSLDEKIELNNQMNKTLEEMAQALFKRWFVDFKFPNENGEPYKSSGGEMIDSELGMIPKEWKVGNIYDIADVVYGAAFKSKQFNEDKLGLPLIRIRDLKTFTPAFYTDEQHKKATIVEPGDILIGMDAEFTPTIWQGEKGYLNQRVCMIKPNNKYTSNYYLYEMIKPKMKFLEHSKVGTTVIHLGKSDIDAIRIVLPQKQVLEKFKAISENITDKIVQLSREKFILEGLRDTLLPKLMSGEIRVTDLQN